MEDLSPLKSSMVSTMAINQDPEDRTTFVMLVSDGNSSL